MQLRWEIKADQPRMYAIKDRFISLPEFRARLNVMLRPRNSICMVLEHGDFIESYVICYLNGKQMDIGVMELADHGPLSVEEMVTGMCHRLAQKLGHKRCCMTFWADAYDLAVQVALRDCGWKAIREDEGRIFFYWSRDAEYFPVCPDLPEPDLQFAL